MRAGTTPAGARARDGRLWFGTANGVVLVDPAHQRRNLAPPPVAIESMQVDGKDVDPTNAGKLEPGYSHARLTRQQSDASPSQTMAVMNSDDGLVGTVQQASEPPEKSRAGIGTAPMLVLN